MNNHFVTWVLAVWMVMGAAVACDSGKSSVKDEDVLNNTNNQQDVQQPDVPDDVQVTDPEELLRLAPDHEIVKVSLFQAVEVVLHENGQLQDPVNAVIVGGIDARLVVWVTAASPRPVVLVVTATSGAQVWQTEAEVTFATQVNTAQPAAAVSLVIPGNAIQATPGITVRVVDPAAEKVAESVEHPARFFSMEAPYVVPTASEMPPVKLELIPIRYLRRGTEYLPDTSEAQIRRYRELLEAVYPGKFEITLQEEMFWDDPFTWTGNFDFGDLNVALRNRKNNSDSPRESYWYALVAPAETFSAYCGSSCVTGQSYLVTDPAAHSYRVGGGMGFSGESSAWTLVHELGHLFGRRHSGCNVSKDDRDYPYDGGRIGVWGYDVRMGAWLDPQVAADFMGYCDPSWVADYTWNALYERMVHLWGLYPPMMWGAPGAGAGDAEAPEVPGAGVGAPGAGDAQGVGAGAPGAGDWVRPLDVNLVSRTARWGELTEPAHLSERMDVVVFGPSGPTTVGVPVVFQSHGGGFTLEVPLDFDGMELFLPGFSDILLSF